MIEEIKKELLLTNAFIKIGPNADYKIEITKVFEILDKYKCRSNVADVSQLENQELVKYKSAWEELKILQKINELNAVNVGSCLELIKELEQKHNIEVKK